MSSSLFGGKLKSDAVMVSSGVLWRSKRSEALILREKESVSSTNGRAVQVSKACCEGRLALVMLNAVP